MTFNLGDVPMCETFATTKSPVSERRIAANRENAKRSTGPNTEHGKRQSRRNALKHGLSGAGVALPESMEEAVQERAQNWNSSLKPINAWELWLLEFVALNTLRVEECAKMAYQRRRAVAERADSLLWDEDRNLEVEEIGAKLALKPSETVQRLRQSGYGVHWLLTRWEMLESALKAWGSLNEEQYRLAFHLRGLPIEARAIDPTYNGLSSPEELKELIAGEIALLQALIDDGIFSLDEEERLSAMEGTNLDQTKEGKLLKRYGDQAANLLKWALRQFKNGRHVYEGHVQNGSLPASMRQPTNPPVVFDPGPLHGSSASDAPEPVDQSIEPAAAPLKEAVAEPASRPLGLMAKLANKIGDGARSTLELIKSASLGEGDADDFDSNRCDRHYDHLAERKLLGSRARAELGLSGA